MSHRRKHRAIVRPHAKPQPEIGESPAPQPVQSYTGEEVARLRCGFLDSLDRWTLFFHSLNSDVWRSPPDAFLAWKAKQRVTVEGWLLDAVDDTLAYWSEHPRSHQAALTPDYQHFAWRGGAVRLPLFAPVFTPPQTGTPPGFAALAMNIPVAARGMLKPLITEEPPERLKARYQMEFKRQLDEYIYQYRGAVAAEQWLTKHPETLQHLTWLMYRVDGIPLEEVVQRVEASPRRRYEDPRGAITRMVNKLSTAIGINLEPWK